jgi:integrase/recombinase XerD
VVLAANGRIKPDHVIVKGNLEKHSEGSYYLEWRKGSKRVRLSVGKDAADASTQRQRKEAELNAVNNGVAVAPDANKGKRSLPDSVAAFLEDVRLKLAASKKSHGRHNTVGCYSTALAYFLESCTKQYPEDIDRHDLLVFSAYLASEKEQGPRSTYNKFQIVMSFLKAQGIHKLVCKNDWPKYTEAEPETYEQEDLDKLFAACDAQEKLWFEFFLMTGMREQEVIFCYWSDVNFAASTVRVTYKPDRQWTPKAYKEREIPIPEKLCVSLKAKKEKSASGCNLVFPTSGCKPKFDFLDCLKGIVRRAGLPEENFWLHKFRSTFATHSLHSGIDVRTVQSWLGHSDIESTMRYLKPSRSKQTRDKVNLIWKSGLGPDDV